MIGRLARAGCLSTSAGLSRCAYHPSLLLPSVLRTYCRSPFKLDASRIGLSSLSGAHTFRVCHSLFSLAFALCAHRRVGEDKIVAALISKGGKQCSLAPTHAAHTKGTFDSHTLVVCFHQVFFDAAGLRVTSRAHALHSIGQAKPEGLQKDGASPSQRGRPMKLSRRAAARADVGFACSSQRRHASS